jgi:hypothetical protein
MGREVTRLVNNKTKQPGQYTVTWNAMNQASGLYFVKLVTPNHTSSQKLMVLK